jgi:segregation and condensation protein B
MSDDTKTEYDKETGLRLLEAILFATNEPLSEAVLQDHVGEGVDVAELLKTLQENCAARGVNLVTTDGLWSFRTAPDLAPMMKSRASEAPPAKAAAEVLSIIAYHQPITRSEIESIRGVETSRGTLDYSS